MPWGRGRGLGLAPTLSPYSFGNGFYNGIGFAKRLRIAKMQHSQS